MYNSPLITGINMILSISALLGISIISNKILYLESINRKKGIIITNIKQAINDGNTDELIVIINKYPKSFVSNILQTSIAAYTNNLYIENNHLISVIENRIKRSKILLSYKLKKNLNLLLSIGITAPMMGVFSSIVIINNAFHWLGTTDLDPAIHLFLLMSKAPEEIALGLVIGITAILFYFYFKARLEKFDTEMEIISNEILYYVYKSR